MKGLGYKMSGEILGFTIWSLVALIFLIIAIVSLRSEKPVGFYTGVKPPEVKDIKKYNKAVSTIWFVFFGVFELLGLPLLFYRQNSPIFIISILGTVFLCISIAIAYNHVLNKYKK